ncbi:hypothetical protein GCM10027265_45450 [Jatrophihabitans fulvus]
MLVAVAAVASGPAAAAPPTRDRGAPAAGSRRPPSAVTYVPPVAPPTVVRPFDPPAGPYGPGHRGVDLATRRGAVVVAAAAGTVTFAGAVAGRGVVVVAHADGIRTEYEPVRPSVRAGTPVARGQPVGVVTGSHRGCPAGCVHWGARRGEVYLDPLELLRPLGPVRLLPWP